MRRPFIVAEIGMPGARRQDQVIKREPTAIVEDERFAGHVNRCDRCQQYSYVALPPEYPPDRGRDIARRQGRGRDLVKQRLKHMVVVPVDERDLDIGSTQ